MIPILFGPELHAVRGFKGQTFPYSFTKSGDALEWH